MESAEINHELNTIINQAKHKFPNTFKNLGLKQSCKRLEMIFSSPYIENWKL